ncbi:MAG: TIGR03564 family F420-dependent LLM class oxidoreductase [Acidimicrobiales bacterium]
MATDGKKMGVGWGLAGGVALRSVDEVRRAARWAEQTGFDGFWVSQSTAVDPTVALAAIAGDIPTLAEVGTSVVPLYGRHPLGLSQMVRTAQSALGGRLTLGIGPSHREPVEGSLGIAWDRPLGYTREFLDGILPLLAGEPANSEGEQLTTRAELNIEAPNTSILLAALGPNMLKLAGARTAGTTVGQCGPNTIRTHIAPLVHQAAADAGRPKPRIMALIRFCVTDDHDGAYALARDVGAGYARLPSYAAVLEREGMGEPADLHLIGSAEQVLDGLGRYVEAGVTDFRLEVSAPTEAARDSSRAALVEYLR